MDNQVKQLRNWKAVSAILSVLAFALIIVLLVIGVKGIRESAFKPLPDPPASSFTTTESENGTEITEVSAVVTEETEITAETEAAVVDPLSLWTENAPAKKALVSYIETVTNENSADYIPVENRIAVFDMDGTILCETDPYYFDHSWFTVCLKIRITRIKPQLLRRMLLTGFRPNLMVTRVWKCR